MSGVVVCVKPVCASLGVFCGPLTVDGRRRPGRGLAADSRLRSVAWARLRRETRSRCSGLPPQPLTRLPRPPARRRADAARCEAPQVRQEYLFPQRPLARQRRLDLQALRFAQPGGQPVAPGRLAGEGRVAPRASSRGGPSASGAAGRRFGRAPPAPPPPAPVPPSPRVFRRRRPGPLRRRADVAGRDGSDSSQTTARSTQRPGSSSALR